jgi:hypothetical protein
MGEYLLRERVRFWCIGALHSKWFSLHYFCISSLIVNHLNLDVHIFNCFVLFIVIVVF